MEWATKYHLANRCKQCTPQQRDILGGLPSLVRSSDISSNCPSNAAMKTWDSCPWINKTLGCWFFAAFTSQITQFIANLPNRNRLSRWLANIPSKMEMHKTIQQNFPFAKLNVSYKLIQVDWGNKFHQDSHCPKNRRLVKSNRVGPL